MICPATAVVPVTRWPRHDATTQWFHFHSCSRVRRFWQSGRTGQRLPLESQEESKDTMRCSGEQRSKRQKCWEQHWMTNEAHYLCAGKVPGRWRDVIAGAAAAGGLAVAVRQRAGRRHQPGGSALPLRSLPSSDAGSGTS